MSSESGLEWMQIHDDHMEEIWQQERRGLRKIAIIHYAYYKELDRLKDIVKDEFSQVKSAFKRKEDLNKRKKFTGLAQSERFEFDIIDLVKDEKETNKRTESMPLNQHDNTEAKTEDYFIETPNTHAFKFQSPSPEAVKFDTAVSPVLNRCSYPKPTRKNVSSPAILIPFSTDEISKIKRSNVSSPSILSPFYNMKTSKMEQPTSKRKQSNSPTNPVRKMPRLASTKPSDLIPFTQIAPKLEKLSQLRTPANFDDSNIMESSVIEDTPAMKKERKSKRPRLKLKMNKSKQANTLTQMFFEPKKVKKEFDSNLPSMGVTEMLDYVNEPEAELDRSDETVDGLEMPTTSQIEAGCSSICDNAPQVQNRPDLKEGTNLKGTSCPECPEFRGQFNLPQEKLQQKMSLCARHRNRANQRQETFEDFWDLTFGSSPKSQEESMVFNFKNP